MSDHSFNAHYIFLPILAILIFLNAAYPALPDTQEQETQKDNLVLVNKLIEFSNSSAINFLDLAEEIVQDIIKSPQSKAIQQEATLLLGKLKSLQAQSEKSPDKYIQLSNDAINIIKGVITDNPEEMIEARFEIAEILYQQGQFIAGLAQTEIDPSRKQTLHEQAEKSYQQTAEYILAVKEAYQKISLQAIGETKDEEAENALVRASYIYGLNYYYWGLLYNEEDKDRIIRLQDAIKCLKDFVARFGDRFISYEATDFLGLCYYEMKDYPNANGFFLMTTILYNVIKNDEQKSQEEKDELIDKWQDVIQKGYAHMAMVFNEARQFRESIQAVDRLLKIFPVKGVEPLWIERARIEKAHALFHSNEKELAYSIVKGIREHSQKGIVISYANDILNGFIQDAGDNAPAGIVLGTMLDLFNKNKFAETVQKGQILINKLGLSPEEERSKYIPEALFIMAESFRMQERYYEAIILYENIYLNPKYKYAKMNKGDDIAPWAAYWSYISYSKMSVETGDETDNLKYKETLEHLTKTWPESAPATEVRYLQAREYESKGYYLEAGKSYSEVLPSSKYYYESRFRRGLMHYFLPIRNLYAAYQREPEGAQKDSIKAQILHHLLEAEKKFNEAISLYESKSNNLLDNETKTRILHNDLQARVFLATVYLHDFINKPTEALTIMENLEKKHQGNTDAIIQISQLKIDAFIKTNDLKKAEAYFKSLEKDPEITGPALQSLAIAYEKASYKIISAASNNDESGKRKEEIAYKKEQAQEEYKKFASALESSCDYYIRWVNVKGKIADPDDILMVANKLCQYAEEIEKNTYYLTASDFYTRIINKEFQNKLPAKDQLWQIKWKLTKSYLKSKEPQKALAILELLDQERSNNLDIKRELALTYEECGSPGNQSPWQSARKKWIELSKLLDKFTQNWWETKYHHVLIDYKLGNFTEALSNVRFIENAISKDFDNDKWGYKTKFLELKSKLQEKSIRK